MNFWRTPDEFQKLVVDGGVNLATVAFTVIPADVSSIVNLSKYPIRDGTDKVFTPVSLPQVAGSMYSTIDFSTQTFTPIAMTINPDGHEGYAIPKIVPTVSVQFFEPATSTVDLLADARVVVSGIPASIPFLDTFNGPVEINSGELHIGGIVDVYSKGAGVEPETTNDLRLSPIDITASTAEESDVIFTANDGIATAEGFTSVALSAFISSLSTEQVFSLNQTGMAVHVVDSPIEPTLNGRVFILTGVTGAVIPRPDEIVTPFPGGPITDIVFRVLRKATTDVTDPNIVLQSGTDLIVPLLEEYVENVAGFSFIEDPNSVPIYIQILEGENEGEYPVTAKAANRLDIDATMHGPETGVSYRVVLKQVPVLTPVVRITSVAGADEASNTGVSVPPAEPLFHESGSFAGLNNDPLTDVVLGATGTITTTGPTTPATFATVPATDFVAAGVIVGDVLKIHGITDQFYYATAVTPGAVTLNVPVSSTTTGLSFTLGHPAVGKVKSYFRERTYYRVQNNSDGFASTLVKNADDTLRWRPSPAERADLYTPRFDLGDTVLLTTTPEVERTNGTYSWEAYDIVPGDVVEVVRQVLEGTAIADINNIDVSGKTLRFTQDGVNRYVTFEATGGSPTLTLEEVVAQINAKFSDVHAASSGSLLRLYSESAVVVLGTADVLTELGLTINDTNVYTGDRIFTIDTISSVLPTSVHTLGISGGTVAADTEVFVKVYRNGAQHVFPADMVEEDTGLFSFEWVATSLEPWTTQTSEAGEQLTVEGAVSMGYRLTTPNAEYTYSTLEELHLVSPVRFLGPEADSFENVFPAAETYVNIEYDRSSLVANIQQLLLLPTHRDVCSNVLSRHYLPAYPWLHVEYRGNVPEETVKEELVELLASAHPNDPIESFDIASALSTIGVTYAKQPQSVILETHNKDRTVGAVTSLDAASLSRLYHLMDNTDRVTVKKVG
jgi:hypothetical protein